MEFNSDKTALKIETQKTTTKACRVITKPAYTDYNTLKHKYHDHNLFSSS